MCGRQTRSRKPLSDRRGRTGRRQPGGMRPHRRQGQRPRHVTRTRQCYTMLPTRLPAHRCHQAGRHGGRERACPSNAMLPALYSLGGSAAAPACAASLTPRARSHCATHTEIIQWSLVHTSKLCKLCASAVRLQLCGGHGSGTGNSTRCAAPTAITAAKEGHARRSELRA